MRNGVDENTVITLWQELVSAGYDFTTESRQTVRVPYAGRPSHTAGADLTDAVLEIDGQTVTGNIEFHVFAGDWRRHGHHRDKNYNGVVLQVVMWRQSGETTCLENGRLLPTIAVGRFYDNIKQCGMETIPQQFLPCYQMAEKSPENVVVALEQSGIARFRGKASLFQSELRQHAPDEVLYRGLMEALGYAQNKMPFLKLAGAVASGSLADIIAAGNSTRLAAVLYGAAGLLPSQRPRVASAEIYVQELESEWRESRMPAVLDISDWSFFRLRPGNFPPRRLAGMVGLLQKYQKTGLRYGLELIVLKSCLEDGGRTLLESLLVMADGYWRNHFDFGKQCAGLSPLTIGEGRAGEMIINIVLPFFDAYGESQKDAKLAAKMRALYTVFPAADANTVEKHMRAQLGLKSSLIKTASRQQGLLHLYQQFCVQGRCAECT